jgi:Fe-S cluster biogenesis protein NfuA
MIRDKLSSGLRRLLGRPQGPTAPAPSPPRSAPAHSSPQEPESGPAAGGSLDAVLVQRVIQEQVRPALQADGGDIELVEIRGADVHVRLQGACRGCPGASMTLRMGVEALLRDEVPGFGRVMDMG